MKYLFLLVWLLSWSFTFAQAEKRNTFTSKKGKFYVYWGWNLSAYTKSDIHFTGTNYDFTLSDLVARDRQSKFEPNLYLNPKTITIPQYNFRLGYFISNQYNISIGIDHMKYVMVNNQQATIDGKINIGNTLYDGSYSNSSITIKPELLTYEHTDGLNYINADIRRIDPLFKIGSSIEVNATEGLGLGILIPKTNAQLLGFQRHDDFHISGYGLNAMLGINITFLKHFYVQSEWKGGFVNLPKVRTTNFKADNAQQHFFFTQVNIVFGGYFSLF